MKRIVLTEPSPTVEETAKTMGVSRKRLRVIVKTMDAIINKSGKSARVSASRTKKKNSQP